MVEFKEIESYFKERATELKKMTKQGTPWEFLCISAFIEYLSKLVNGADGQHYRQYKKFIKEYFGKVNSLYENFTYRCGKKDLSTQMYNVLRCGIVHAFSMVPSEESRKKGGRIRSIVLCHKKSGRLHLTNYHTKNIADAAIFVAEDFAEDTIQVVNNIFQKAQKDTNLKGHIINWYSKQTPILGKY